MNCRVVVATFLELVVVAEWLESPETEDRTVGKAARTTAPAETTELRLDSVEDPRVVVARSLDGIGSASWRQCSSWFSLVGFLLCSFWFLGTLRCYGLCHDIGSRSMDLLDHSSELSGVLFPFLFLLTQNHLLCSVCCPGGTEDFLHC